MSEKGHQMYEASLFKDKKLIKTPNLLDLESARKSFSWDKYWQEIETFENGKMNAAHNVIDVHSVGPNRNKVALYFEGDDGKTEKYTFGEMADLSNKFANVLKKLGVRRQDRVFYFLSRSPELYVSFIGTLKVGAIAGTMFPAFGEDALRDRLLDSGAKYLVTEEQLKERVYKVRDQLPELRHIIVVKKGADSSKGEICYETEMEAASSKFTIEKMDPEEYTYMLYTSGTTGKPKGVVHAHGGIVQQYLSSKWVLDLQPDDTYWCTADLGWVTGIVYGLMGPWANGISQVGYGGRFKPEAWYNVIQKYKVTVWYTAPTAIRMLMAAGDEVPKRYDMSSLRYLCSVGEPLNPEGVKWGLKVFGHPFNDTWWQTETGSILITNYPCMPIKFGSMGKLFPGIEGAIVDEEGKPLPQGAEGDLALKPGWPSMMRTIWKNEKRFNEYFRNGWYITGDTATIDKDGYFWYVGRADDVIKTSGERVGPFEVESALVEHPAVAEAGVIGKPDPLRGNIIKAFVMLKPGQKPSDELRETIQTFVKGKLAGHAYPREIEFVDSLPKTRSGKIMRRVLKAKELGLPIGDTSTLERD
ncbi:MAG: acetate--CoA ligase [Thermoplasmata archaeon]|nr:acetate--CoA ligase [Thermoplasmata archaeon]